ncbi:MAG TPA: restriction endonuclease subunit S [Terracidiphilus sp.]|nr:restriction endonuclease subunit S [Terracidiphilus sp.]
MASEWRILSLQEAKVALIDCDHRTPPPSTSGYPYVAIPQLRNGRINFSDARRITFENYKDWTRKALPIEHDVVLSRRCNPGETAFVSSDVEFALGQNLVLLRADGTEVYPPFLRWLVRGSEWWEQIGKFLNVGAVFDSLRCADVPKFQLPIPPQDEQRAIAHILGTLDDKIELNRRMNETLEAMARALFQSWFVDFDPVRAKAAVRREHPRWTDAEVCRAALPTLSPEIAALFPDSFEDSPLGPIPKGWQLLPLPEAINVNPSRPLRKGAVAPYLDMANMPTQGHSADEVVQREFNSGMRFMNGDTLVARITPCLENGKTAFVDFLDENQVGWGSTEYIVLRPKPPLPNEFAYCLARSADFRDFAIQSMTGSSGRQRVPAESLSHFKITSPSEPIAKLFGGSVEPLFVRAGQAAKESRTLAALRDTLLPKLISGEIRLSHNGELKES